MRRALAAAVMIGCFHRPRPQPAPPCLPELQSRITQLREVSAPVPAGVSDGEALDALAEVLAADGLVVDPRDRGAATLTTRPFAGETLDWTCDLREHREYAYQAAIVDQRWVVRLACARAYGWDAHLAGSKVVPAERGVLTECLERARYATRRDARRGQDAIDRARALLAERRAADPAPDGERAP